MTPDHWTRLRHRRQRFSQLSAAEKRIFFVALWRLAIVALALRIAGFQRVERAIVRRSPSPQSADAQPSPEAIARVVHSAARAGPVRATCLAQSLALWWMLREHTIPAELRLGVHKESNGLTAHAWVEHAGRPLDEAPNITADFAILNHRGAVRPEINRRSATPMQ